jgi:hypothetical protein
LHEQGQQKVTANEFLAEQPLKKRRGLGESHTRVLELTTGRNRGQISTQSLRQSTMQEQRKTDTNTPRHDTIGLEKTYFFLCTETSLARQETQHNSFLRLLLCCQSPFHDELSRGLDLGRISLRRQKPEETVMRFEAESSHRMAAGETLLHKVRCGACISTQSKLFEKPLSNLFSWHVTCSLSHAACHKVCLGTLWILMVPQFAFLRCCCRHARVIMPQQRL